MLEVTLVQRARCTACIIRWEGGQGRGVATNTSWGGWRLQRQRGGRQSVLPGHQATEANTPDRGRGGVGVGQGLNNGHLLRLSWRLEVQDPGLAGLVPPEAPPGRSRRVALSSRVLT